MSPYGEQMKKNTQTQTEKENGKERKRVWENMFPLQLTIFNQMEFVRIGASKWKISVQFFFVTLLAKLNHDKDKTSITENTIAREYVCVWSECNTGVRLCLSISVWAKVLQLMLVIY